MARERTIKALAKVVVAAAWADGDISNEEVNSLKDLLFQLPEMTAEDWSEIEIYIDSPVEEAERQRLLEDLQDALRSEDDKQLALSTLDEIVNADGKITPAEQAMLAEVQPAIKGATTGLLQPLSGLLRGSIDRRSTTAQSAPNRELMLDDYRSNRIYYMVNQRLHAEGITRSLTDEEARRLSLAGGLIARVLYVDRDVTSEEFAALVASLQDHWEISEVKANIVAEVAVSETARGLDLYRLGREFFDCTTVQQRLKFLDVLFAAADADGQVTYEEIEEIRLISKLLKCTHRQFIDAKLKIPSEHRNGL
jgi:uncharacterized tellurite resistance protein B-like protein